AQLGRGRRRGVRTRRGCRVHTRPAAGGDENRRRRCCDDCQPVTGGVKAPTTPTRAVLQPFFEAVWNETMPGFFGCSVSVTLPAPFVRPLRVRMPGPFA